MPILNASGSSSGPIKFVDSIKSFLYVNTGYNALARVLSLSILFIAL